VIRARTRAALAVKKTRGERVGAVPFGYRLAADGVHVDKDEGEQATIARVRELHAVWISQAEDLRRALGRGRRRTQRARLQQDADRSNRRPY